MQRRGSLLPVNPFDVRARPDPYPVYQYMRSVEPVHLSPAGFWVLTRYEDCRQVLDGDGWSHDAGALLEPQRAEGDPVDPTVRLLRASLLFADPPALAARREVVERALRRPAAKIGERAAEVAGRLLALIEEREPTADLARDFSVPLGLVAVADTFGVAAADRISLQRWSRDLVAGLDPGIRAAGVASAAAAAAALAEYWLGRLDAARREDGDGPVDVMARSEIGSWQAAADLGVLFVLAVETTSALIGNALLALLRDQAVRERLAADPGLAGPVVEEAARLDGPWHLTARSAIQRQSIGGSAIEAGELAVLLLAAANRDPAVFPEPDSLRLDRQGPPHLGFGGGPHECLARPFAAAVATAGLGRLAPLLAGIEADGDPEWNPTVTLRGLRRLPVRLAR
ncbi:MAG TPA: cytochrome P450 [Candidatus Dormibacteraeota bacterium]|nr:cytochrome P450 [Candidatus Dormibacteraeota bacterium]